MKSHIIGFVLVTLAKIPMPIKIGTTFQNKLRPSGGGAAGGGRGGDEAGAGGGGRPGAELQLAGRGEAHHHQRGRGARGHSVFCIDLVNVLSDRSKAADCHHVHVS